MPLSLSLQADVAWLLSVVPVVSSVDCITTAFIPQRRLSFSTVGVGSFSRPRGGSCAGADDEKLCVPLFRAVALVDDDVDTRSTCPPNVCSAASNAAGGLNATPGSRSHKLSEVLFAIPPPPPPLQPPPALLKCPCCAGVMRWRGGGGRCCFCCW